MSYREKSAWISFVLILVLLGAYFWNVSGVAAGTLEFRAGLRLQVGLLIAFVVLEVVLHLVAAMQAPNEARAPRDEREQLIDMRATRIAFYVLVAGVLAAVSLMLVTSSAWVVGQHVLLVVMFAHLVKFAAQIVYFRRGV
jgi:hypothetical protein